MACCPRRHTLKKPKAITDETRANDYKALFGTPLGQRVLTDILVKGNVFSPIRHPDPKECDRMEGARQLALHISSFIDFDSSKFSDQHQLAIGDNN